MLKFIRQLVGAELNFCYLRTAILTDKQNFVLTHLVSRKKNIYQSMVSTVPN